MPRHRDDDPDDSDDDFDADEYPEGVYRDDADDPSVPCPYCREPVYEGAQFCPRCENYLSREDAPRDAKPLWVWVCLALALAAAVLTAV